MSAEGVLGQLNQAADKAEQFPAWLERQIADVVNRINSLLSAVPGWLADLVDEIIEQARRLLQQIGELAQRLITWLVENVWPVIRGPYTLYQTGDEWTTTVFSTVTEVAGQTDRSRARVDDYWSGPAANAYWQMIPRQRGAVDKVSEAASTVRETLQSLALTLAALYIGLVAALVAAGIQIAGGSAAVASILGIPPGLVAIVSGLATGIAGVAAIYGVGRELVSGSMEKLATLLELQHDGSAFEDGRWPQATGDIADHTNWSYAG